MALLSEKISFHKSLSDSDTNYKRYMKDRDYWETYYREIYNDDYGRSEEKIYYNLFKGMLKDKPHVILSIEAEPEVLLSTFDPVL